MSKRRDPHKQRKANELAKHNKKQAEQSAKRQADLKEIYREKERKYTYGQVQETLDRMNRRPSFYEDFASPISSFYGNHMGAEETSVLIDSFRFLERVAKSTDPVIIAQDRDEMPNAKTFIKKY